MIKKINVKLKTILLKTFQILKIIPEWLIKK